MTSPQFDAGVLHSLLLSAAAYPPEVSERLRWFLRFAETGSVSDTCEAFAIARTTFYRWARRFNATDLSTLVDQPLTPPRPAGSPPRSLRAAGHAPMEPRRRAIVAGTLRRFALTVSLLLNVAIVSAILGAAWWERVQAGLSHEQSVPAMVTQTHTPPFLSPAESE